MKIAICDDKPEQLAAIKDAVQCYSGLTEAQISTYDNPIIFLEKFDQCGGFDILLLDICMPGILGIDVAKELRVRGVRIEIIFLTTSHQYAVEAFSLKAVHYLVKPFTQAQFNEAMDRAYGNVIEGGVKNIILKTTNGIRNIDGKTILYAEMFDHSQCIYLSDNDRVETRTTLTELNTTLEKLMPGQFVRPHKGYLVNLNFVTELSGTYILIKDGTRLPLSRRSASSIKEAYFSFLFDRK